MNSNAEFYRAEFDSVRAAAFSMNVISGDFDHALKLHIKAAEWMKENQVSIGLLPEFSLTTYDLADAVKADVTQEEAWHNLNELLPHTEGIMMDVGMPIRYKDATFNGCIKIGNGRIYGIKCKTHLADDGLHREGRVVKPWPVGVRASMELAGTQVPIGDLDFRVGSAKTGYVGIKSVICEELWVPGGSNTLAAFAQQGGQIVLWQNASHMGQDKQAQRLGLVQYAVQTCNLAMVSANWNGNQGGLGAVYDGSNFFWLPGQSEPILGKRLSHEEMEITTAVIDVEYAGQARANTASHVPILDVSKTTVTVDDFDWPAVDAPSGTTTVYLESWEESENAEYEQAARGGGLGLMDYIRASGTQGITLSLSGGRDSVSVVLLVWLGVFNALQQLGIDGFRKRYSHFHWLYDWSRLSKTPEFVKRFGTKRWWIDLQSWELRTFVADYKKAHESEEIWNDEICSVRSIMSRLLYCRYQTTSNSIVEAGDEEAKTLQAARAVCEETGASFMAFNIDDEVALEIAGINRIRLIQLHQHLKQGFVSAADLGEEVSEFHDDFLSLQEADIVKMDVASVAQWAERMDVALRWRFGEGEEEHQDNLTLQNIQARIRGKRVENLANLAWHLVIPPSNLSELIIGYFTQGGDDSGGGPNPISTFFKSWLNLFLEWWRDEGPLGLGPCDALDLVLDPEPSAELKPKEMEQTDEGELGSFELRDFFALRLIAGKSPIKMFKEARREDAFSELSDDAIVKCLFEFLKRYQRNYWKLPRTCVGLHLGKANVSPESYFRSVPLSRYFNRPLARLEEFMEHERASAS